MAILGAIIVSHPPLIILTVGRGREREVQATIDACRVVTIGALLIGPFHFLLQNLRRQALACRRVELREL